jgi:hypothetical protein
MRRSTCCLLVVLFGSWSNSLGQNAPKFTAPRIVATFERLGQTGPISPTTIFTPEHWGTFRISTVMVRTARSSDPSSGWFENFTWNDGGGMESSINVENTGLPADSAQGYNDLKIIVRIKAGTPLKVEVNPNRNTSGSRYNVWVVVEQLM